MNQLCGRPPYTRVSGQCRAKPASGLQRRGLPYRLCEWLAKPAVGLHLLGKCIFTRKLLKINPFFVYFAAFRACLTAILHGMNAPYKIYIFLKVEISTFVVYGFLGKSPLCRVPPIIWNFIHETHAEKRIFSCKYTFQYPHGVFAYPPSLGLFVVSLAASAPAPIRATYSLFSRRLVRRCTELPAS